MRCAVIAIAALILPACGGPAVQPGAGAAAPSTRDVSQPPEPLETEFAKPPAESEGAGCNSKPALTSSSPDPSWEQLEMADGRTVSFPEDWVDDPEYLELGPSPESDLSVGIGYSVRTGDPAAWNGIGTDWEFWANSVIPPSVPRREAALPKAGCLLTGSDGVDDFAVSIWPVSAVEAKWVRAVIPLDAPEGERATAMAIVLSPASVDASQ